MEQHRRVRCEGALAVVFTIAALSPQPTGAQYADAAAVVGTMANLETGQPAEGLVTLIAGHPDNLAGTGEDARRDVPVRRRAPRARRGPRPR